MLQLWSASDLFSAQYKYATKLPLIYHPELISPSYRGAQCFIDIIGFYHLAPFKSLWVSQRMEEYAEALIERRGGQ